MTIAHLLSRFFDGQTTLDEERRLYAYFRQENLPAEHAALRDFFCDLSAVDTPAPLAPALPCRRLDRRYVAAAVALVVMTIGSLFSLRLDTYAALTARYGGSYQIVEGRRIDNLREIHADIERTLRQAEAACAEATAQQTIERAEADALHAVSDPIERERLRRFLQEPLNSQ